jgi:hypothetical protein
MVTKKSAGRPSVRDDIVEGGFRKYVALAMELRMRGGEGREEAARNVTRYLSRLGADFGGKAGWPRIADFRDEQTGTKGFTALVERYVAGFDRPKQVADKLMDLMPAWFPTKFRKTRDINRND